MPPPVLAENVSLAPLTTFAVGGPARYFAEPEDVDALRDVLAWARDERLPVAVLGGGSNVVIADRGFDGLVIRIGFGAVTAGDHPSAGSGDVHLAVGAGVPWDDVVARAVGEGWAGIECLSGVPGRTGAAPIQNIGAYGQEIGPVIAGVEVVWRDTGSVERLAPGALGLRYRFSRFKGEWRDRAVITAVHLRLQRGGAAAVRYPDLIDRLGVREGGPVPSLAEVREATLAVRAAKSMLAAPDDPNRKSAGSFFLNPMVPPEVAERIAACSGYGSEVPRFPEPGGLVKLPAAWLIERAGFPRGSIDGAAGLSTRHALAVVNRGEAKAADVLRLAGRIRQAVREAFGIILEPEPAFLGFDAPVSAILDAAS